MSEYESFELRLHCDMLRHLSDCRFAQPYPLAVGFEIRMPTVAYCILLSTSHGRVLWLKTKGETE